MLWEFVFAGYSYSWERREGRKERKGGRKRKKSKGVGPVLNTDGHIPCPGWGQFLVAFVVLLRDTVALVPWVPCSTALSTCCCE